MNHSEFRALFPALGERIWLDTPGAPPAALPVTAALTRALEDWSSGTFDWLHWDGAAARARDQFADYLGVAAGTVATLGSLSEAAATVAHTITVGEIVVAEDEFRSNLYPWMRLLGDDNRVRVAPRVAGRSRTDVLLDAIGPDTALVAASEVITLDGERVDLRELRRATDAVGARLFVNVTQTLGVLDSRLDELAADYVAVHGYKWMLCPRGTAWLAARPDRVAELRPLAPSWKSTGSPQGYFGGGYREAPDASRCDTSPAWLSWIGAEAALAILSGLDRAGTQAHCLGLAQRFRDGAAALGCVEANAGAPSHIVAVDTPDGEHVAASLHRHRIAATVTGNRLRVGFHYFNDESDVDTTLDALRLAIDGRDVRR
ncbi:aminotransferase class V-fold PLP-dependent enzyme [Prescottella agglutinans]|uniref:Aminotransferase class V-fold PLP-dependent enzyme n=1 Tax=Prescottella agglutinans TaxID=1644129 RepID=A0A3S3AIP2_9NOCA|nr:aminotransferase class V-fold PLP-dependent enzyme [Prescottella agglutinans]RVW10991.1 aminotransferase class V-fold PLP-dependent enzyme [Prescottella agglutinans]